MKIRDRKKEMEDKYLTVVEEHVDRLGEMAKNIHEVSSKSKGRGSHSYPCPSLSYTYRLRLCSVEIQGP